MNHHYLVPFLLTLTLVACGSAGAPAPHAASLDQETQLAPGERAVFSQQALDVEFVRVVADSRCPSDVECVWAGEVKVQLSIQISPAEATRHEIVAGQNAAVGDYRVFVLQVQPEPISTRTISPDEYRATVKVEQTSR